MKKSIYSIVLAVVLLVSTIKVYADDTVSLELRTINLEEMTSDEIDNFSKAILDSTLSNNKEAIAKYANCFTDEKLTKIYEFITNNNISGTVQSMVVDWVYPKYSNTGDSVLMLNAKIQLSGYNELYLFEFHINADGKIYGYNIWTY